MHYLTLVFLEKELVEGKSEDEIFKSAAKLMDNHSYCDEFGSYPYFDYSIFGGRWYDLFDKIIQPIWKASIINCYAIATKNGFSWEEDDGFIEFKNKELESHEDGYFVIVDCHI